MTNRDQYRRLCREASDLSIFEQDWYLDAVCTTEDWSAAIVEENGRIVAALPYATKKKWGFRYAVLPPLVKMLGPWLAGGNQKISRQHQYYDQLIRQLPKLDSYRQSFHYRCTNWLPFYWQGFSQTTRYSYVLDLEDPEQVYAGFNRNVRRNIKKAEAQLHIRHDLGIGELYRLCTRSFDRQKKSFPFSLELIRKHDRALADHQARQHFFAVDDQGRVHSAACLIWDRQRAYYHLAGDDPDLRDSGSPIWLTWQAIRYAVEELKLPLFDFEGSMLPHIEPIRRQFGARQEPYFEVWKDFNPVMKWARALGRR